jgi:hypothetical protein
MSKNIKTSFSVTTVLVAVLASGFATAAESGAAAAQDQAMERVATRASHKMANQFHRRQVLDGRAEFARLEIAPEMADTPRRIYVKRGNRFHPAN